MSNLSVLNVYETAADIGREVENVIDEFGSDSMCKLMPHIIRVLEQLEALVTQKDLDRGRIERLEEEFITVNRDGVRKNEDILKLQMEIRQLEELIKNEEIDLMNVADRIQRENRLLKEELSETQKLSVSDMVQEQETMKVLNQLKETVDKQRDDVRLKDADIRAKTEEMEALQQQVERMFKVNSNLHRKNQHQEEIAKNLIHEKSQMQSELAAMKQESAPPVTQMMNVGRLPSNGEGQDAVDGKVEEEEDVTGKKSAKVVATSSSQSEDGGDDGKPPSNMQLINLEGKMVIDMKDPARPRFTLKEMAFVLEERDTLKMQVMEMEDELEVYRPKENTALVLQPVQKRDRADSGIKRFFSDFVKKLSPQKKKAPGYKDGAWEVLDPKEIRVKKTRNLYREEELHSPLGDVVPGVVEEEPEDNVEEVRLNVFLGEPIGTLPDGNLNKSLDTNHFAGILSGLRSRGADAGGGGGDEAEQGEKDIDGVVAEEKTASGDGVEAAVPIQCLNGTADPDINGNSSDVAAGADSLPTTSHGSETPVGEGAGGSKRKDNS